MVGNNVLGHVIWFNPVLGYGFAKNYSLRNDKTPYVFFHRSAISKDYPSNLRQRVEADENIEFDIIETRKGWEAINVRRDKCIPYKRGNMFAFDFKPKFQASKLGEFCISKDTELNRIQLLAHFKPFSRFNIRRNKVSNNRSNAIYGKEMEPIILKRINNEKRVIFKKTNSIISKKFQNFEITGIVDGINHQKDLIIEIKTRNFNLSTKKTISMDEKIQVMAYMYLYDECYECLFVEHGKDGEIKKTMIRWDDQFFNEIVINRLEEFVSYARNMSIEMYENLLDKYHLR